MYKERRQSGLKSLRQDDFKDVENHYDDESENSEIICSEDGK